MNTGGSEIFITVRCRGEAEIGSTVLRLSRSSTFAEKRLLEVITFPDVYVPKYFGCPWRPQCVSDCADWDGTSWKTGGRRRYVLFPRLELDPVRYIEFVKPLSECSSFARTLVQLTLSPTPTQREPVFLELVIRTKYQPSVHISWYRRILRLINEFIHLYEAMAWLSTLGGAYSAMGDYGNRYAEIAKKISLKQLRLALNSGDPTHVSRCWIFIAMSAMQHGLLSHSRKLLLKQWEFAQSAEGDRDPRLKNMILGTWELLKQKHKQRKLLRITALKRPML